MKPVIIFSPSSPHIINMPLFKLIDRSPITSTFVVGRNDRCYILRFIWAVVIAYATPLREPSGLVCNISAGVL